MSRDSNEMRAQSAKTRAKARGRSELGERDKAPTWQSRVQGEQRDKQPGEGALSTRDPPRTLWGPQASSTAVWGPAGEAASARQRAYPGAAHTAVSEVLK